MILAWHRAFAADPRLELVGLTWDDEVGAPSLILFTFRRDAWRVPQPCSLTLNARHGGYALVVEFTGARFRAGAGLPGLTLMNSGQPTVVRDTVTAYLGRREVCGWLIDVGKPIDERVGWLTWQPNPTLRSVRFWRAVRRAMRGLVDDWHAIRAFAGEPGPEAPPSRKVPLETAVRKLIGGWS